MFYQKDIFLRTENETSKSHLLFKSFFTARGALEKADAEEIFLQHAADFSNIKLPSDRLVPSWGPVRVLTQAAQLLKFAYTRFKQEMKTSEIMYATGEYAPENLVSVLNLP
jgi:hypothetical protein